MHDHLPNDTGLTHLPDALFKPLKGQKQWSFLTELYHLLHLSLLHGAIYWDAETRKAKLLEYQTSFPKSGCKCGTPRVGWSLCKGVLLVNICRAGLGFLKQCGCLESWCFPHGPDEQNSDSGVRWHRSQKLCFSALITSFCTSHDQRLNRDNFPSCFPIHPLSEKVSLDALTQ